MTDTASPDPQSDEPIDVEQAAINFDRAIHDPARRQDAMGDLFSALGAAAQRMSELRRAAREAAREVRRNDPATRARRSAGARRGWEVRRAREAREEALAALDGGPVRTGPVCGEINHNSVGSEVFCQLDPGHKEDKEDHDDGNGVTWPCED
ncbi:hypothetical protein [Streptomyces asiaticus]|uniref:hypothetical protein n=1 Tax=Streptomyces asiaticus TaxID=114695 RepID=UPI00382B6A32